MIDQWALSKMGWLVLVARSIYIYDVIFRPHKLNSLLRVTVRMQFWISCKISLFIYHCCTGLCARLNQRMCPIFTLQWWRKAAMNDEKWTPSRMFFLQKLLTINSKFSLDGLMFSHWSIVNLNVRKWIDNLNRTVYIYNILEPVFFIACTKSAHPSKAKIWTLRLNHSLPVCMLYFASKEWCITP